METDNKKLLSISEVAKYLGISRYGVIQLIKTNVVKAVDIGKRMGYGVMAAQQTLTLLV